MKALRYFIVAVFLTLVSISAYPQCAMCNLNAENSVKNGNTEGRGLNDGILYLLAAPYVAVAAIGLIWFKRYRRKESPDTIGE